MARRALRAPNLPFTSSCQGRGTWAIGCEDSVPGMKHGWKRIQGSAHDHARVLAFSASRTARTRRMKQERPEGSGMEWFPANQISGCARNSDCQMIAIISCPNHIKPLLSIVHCYPSFTFEKSYSSSVHLVKSSGEASSRPAVAWGSSSLS